MIIKFGPQGLSNYLDELVNWKKEIIAVLIENLKMKSLNMRKQAEFDNATRCYPCRQEIKKDDN